MKIERRPKKYSLQVTTKRHQRRRIPDGWRNRELMRWCFAPITLRNALQSGHWSPWMVSSRHTWLVTVSCWRQPLDDVSSVQRAVPTCLVPRTTTGLFGADFSRLPYPYLCVTVKHLLVLGRTSEDAFLSFYSSCLILFSSFYLV